MTTMLSAELNLFHVFLFLSRTCMKYALEIGNNLLFLSSPVSTGKVYHTSKLLGLAFVGAFKKPTPNAVTPNSVVLFCDYQHGQILAMYWILKEELEKQKMLTEKLCHIAPIWLTLITTCKYVICTWKLIWENESFTKLSRSNCLIFVLSIVNV